MPIRGTTLIPIVLLTVVPTLSAQNLPGALSVPPVPPTVVTGGSSLSPTGTSQPAHRANLIVNGDLEIYAGDDCDDNLPNTSFTSLMANATAFGAADELDVYKAGCFGLPPVSGERKVAMNGQHYGAMDAFSLDLSPPVVAGTTYTMSFWVYSDSTWTPNLGHIEIGLSDTETIAGTLVYAGSSTGFDVWEQFTTTFTAPVDANFLTVAQAELDAWTHVDAFSLEPSSPGVGYCFGDPGVDTPCPCNNDNDGSIPGSGCDNGTFSSGAKLSASGIASLSNDTLVLTATHLEPSNSGLYFQANNDRSPGVLWGDGLSCAGGALKRLQLRFSSPAGSSSTTIGISAKAGNIAAGDTKYYQIWYRDPAGSPCGHDFNSSNGYAITWLP